MKTGKAVIAVVAILLAALSAAGCRDGFRHEDEGTGINIPRWRGVQPGTAYLGEDVLWRPREWLVFHMYDAKGGGFQLDFTVRDMNTYIQGPVRVMFWVVGPGGQTLSREFMEDDGIVSGNERYRDGIEDIYQDYRYREWHRAHSPGGYPPGKERSPYLERPEKLSFRRKSVQVPDGGAGLYRVVIVGSWDHWISITPDRPIPTGVHPGPGPLHVETGRMEEAFLYVPSAAREIGISTVEEIQPYNWQVILEDEAGNVVGKTEPRNFTNYIVHTPAAGDKVYRLRITGDTAGAHLNVMGIPFVICPDRYTASKIRGGTEVDDKGRLTFHHFQRVLNDWAYGLKPEELEVPAPPANPELIKNSQLRGIIAELPTLLKTQNLDPHSEQFGTIPDRNILNKLAEIAAYDDPNNPYFQNHALVRRIILGRFSWLNQMSPFFWDIRPYDYPRTFNVRETALMSSPLRTNWYSFGGYSMSIVNDIPVRDMVPEVLPEDAFNAWGLWLDNLVYGRWNMRVGEMVNQWLYSLTHMMYIWRFTGNPEIPGLVNSHLEYMLNPGVMGRINPDPTPYRSSLGYGYSADMGRVGAGYLSEQQGWDGNYAAWCQENGLHRLWNWLKNPLIIDYLNEYNTLKTHLSLTRHGKHALNPWREVIAPTDFNFRTRGAPFSPTFANNLPEEIVRGIPYGELWIRGGAEQPEKPWPCMDENPFVRVMDNKFFFINTGSYYGISYGGHVLPDWPQFARAEVKDGTARLSGYTSMGRDGRGRKSTKPGGLSALFVRNCGPVILSQNHDVMYSNTVWGRRKSPIAGIHAADLDPAVISSGYVDANVEFFGESRILRKSGSFAYAPIHFTRTIHFRDDMVEVRVELMATDDFSLAELYEAIPFYADDRIVQAFDNDFSPGAGYNPMDYTDIKRLSCRAVTFRGESGAGATVIFDKTYNVVQSQHVRVRREAPATMSLSLALPAELAAGQRVQLRYVIVPHQKPLTGREIMDISREENLL